MKRTTAAVVVALLLLAGCAGGPTEMDEAACRGVAQYDNQIHELVVVADTVDARQVEEVSDRFPRDVADARALAKDARLADELARLAAVVDHRTDDPATAGFAQYDAQYNAVIDRCQSLGVDVERAGR